MSLLTVVQHVCGRTNIPVPSSVLGSTTDAQILQLLRLLEEEGNDLADRGPWQALTHEFTHTTLNQEDQGVMSSIATNGFKAIKNGTFFDRSDTLPVMGPLSDREWQDRKARAVAGPRYYYRFRGDHLLVNPAPTAGHTWAGEYLSKFWILGADGTTYKQYFTLDSDTILLPEEVVLMGLRWRWKKEKGFAYEEDFRTYEMMVKSALGRDGGKPVLCMDGESRRNQPGVIVPEYSWFQ